ncbi:aldehyde dehydrogenase family protein [Amycolatopsis minnesotensis]|uniref:Aldehyde dehydrogenase family protein n=1 Tax=Amycolatopsis minnesotensis TaxID=337894 RepID=A0ABN2QNX1_9PSEU
MTVSVDPALVVPESGVLLGDGMVTSTSAGSVDHVYAADGTVTGSFPLAGADEVDHAVRLAADAAPGWRALPADQRRNVLLRFADLLVAHAGELGALQTLEIGLPVQFTSRMAEVAADHLRYYAGWADKIGGEVVPTWPVRALDYTLDEPYGVVAIIIPWNGPLVSMGQMLGPALATGNTVVVKPSELTPFVAGRVGALAVEAGLPSGVLAVLPGGPATGQALVRHPGVDKVHFTGGAATARAVLDGARELLKPVGMELGGKSAHLVFADSDPRFSARLAMAGVVALSGQGCANGTRVLVESSVYEQVLDVLTARLRRVVVGDPRAARTMMGPLVSAAACERVLGFVSRARERGDGKLVLGGERLGGPLADGYFLGPTVFAEAGQDGELVQEEIFGPVLTVQRFTRDDEAVAMANGTRYGLAAYLHTSDLRRAHRLAADLTAGNVWVNGVPGMAAGAPFGGTKQSGYGRIGGVSGLREFTRPKNVWLPC